MEINRQLFSRAVNGDLRLLACFKHEAYSLTPALFGILFNGKDLKAKMLAHDLLTEHGDACRLMEMFVATDADRQPVQAELALLLLANMTPDSTVKSVVDEIKNEKN